MAGGDAEEGFGFEAAGGGAVGEDGVVVGDGFAAAVEVAEGFGADEGGVYDDADFGGVVEDGLGVDEGGVVFFGGEGLFGEEGLGGGDVAGVGVFFEEEFDVGDAGEMCIRDRGGSGGLLLLFDFGEEVACAGEGVNDGGVFAFGVADDA